MSSMYLTTRVSVPASLAAGDRPDDEKGLRPRRDRVGERGIGRLVGQVPLAREKSQERPPLLGDVIADRPAQHGIVGLEGVEHRAPSDRPLPGDVERHLAFDLRQRPQVRRAHHPDQNRESKPLDSRHYVISYAAFFFKKKKNTNSRKRRPGPGRTT